MSEWELPKNVEMQSIESTGGGFIWESGVYDATVKMVYINQTASEAKWFNVILEKNSGNFSELRENFCIKSGKRIIFTLLCVVSFITFSFTGFNTKIFSKL